MGIVGAGAVTQRKAWFRQKPLVGTWLFRDHSVRFYFAFSRCRIHM